ncbi:MAG: lipid-binding SYLF domain-containing protein [Verrucomicrobiales bacterium]|nr:lipid-binding SYLF domain-containing protein [Verrucomicrobiales bacterium]
MKILLIRPGLFCALVVGFSLLSGIPVQANPFKKSQEELEARISENRLRFEQRQLRRGESIPWQIMNDARGIIIMHQVKAGLGIGAEFGNGVASVKGADGKWGTPGFVSLSKGSYGFQIGANEVVTIMLLMTDESLRLLKGGGSGNVGLNVAAVAGPLDAGGEIDSNTVREPVLIYSDARGAFIGAALQAGAVVEAKKKNDTLYGAALEEILFSGRVAPTAAGAALIATLNQAGVERFYTQ